MKKIFTLLTVIFLATKLFAQSPEGIIYQAEARDNLGNIIQNESLDVKITILEDESNGPIVWEGLHVVTTNKFGMFVLAIGTGENSTGKYFEDIDWGNHSHFLNVQVKRAAASDWINMGTTQFLSVPYALHAKTASALVPEPNSTLKAAKIGVPSQVWSLFGNSQSDPEKDKLGTTDKADLVFVTNNIERLRITTDGKLITADGVGLELGGNLAVHGDSTYIDKDLYVGRDVYLNDNDEFSPRGETFNYGKFTVNGITNLNNSLFVTGATTIDETLHTLGNVNFDSNLVVDGFSSLNNSLAVVGSTSLMGILNVDGNSQFRTNVNVNGKFSVNSSKFTVDNTTGNTGLAGNLVASGNGTFANLTVKGTGATKGKHIALFENSAGGDGDGIAIKINKEETTDENNFITFYRKDIVAGRIEGYHHNLGDKPAIIADLIEPMLSSTTDFFTETLGFTSPLSLKLDFIQMSSGTLPSLSGGSLPSLDISFLKADFDFSKGSFPTLHKGSFPQLTFQSPIRFNTGVTEIIQPWTWFKPNWSSMVSDKNNPVFRIFAEAYENDWKSLTDMGITELFIKAAEMEIEANIKSEGITYGSKGADYAEWLPRINEADKLTFGQVVGVSGGKISLNTENADQLLVISSKPIVLGNMPEDGKEILYEKVAFMGQVPTWVKGDVNIGDYILASGKNDGAGIAVSPNNIKIENIQYIIGKAWSESSNSLLNLINVAIGLNRNDISKIVLSQQAQVNNLESRLNNLEKKLNDLTGIYSENK